MDKVNNPCIASIFMKNIDQNTVMSQQKVVQKFNPTNITHYPVLSDAPPGYTMDKLVEMLKGKGHDAIMFLDIDCVPVCAEALQYMFDQAYSGKVIGDAQRSNHIENNQHVFAAPHNVTFTVADYRKLGNPSFMPNYRGDVAEELTKQQKKQVELQKTMNEADEEIKAADEQLRQADEAIKKGGITGAWNLGAEAVMRQIELLSRFHEDMMERTARIADDTQNAMIVATRAESSARTGTRRAA